MALISEHVHRYSSTLPYTSSCHLETYHMPESWVQSCQHICMWGHEPRQDVDLHG